MPKNLLIVESPAKAKTIKKYLGDDFEVVSSYGHIRDLEKGNDAIDIANNFKPKYVVTPEKAKVVKDLKTAMTNSQEVWLATDEDREGEAIAWHLCEVLRLDLNRTKRITFREITKPAIQKAVQQPRLVNTALVNAQQARRVLDRLVGFELSGLLWRKVKNKLSAGRVQSVAVKLIVEREREITEFETVPFYRVTALFEVKNQQNKRILVKAELPQSFEEEAEARAFLERCRKAIYTVANIKVRPSKRRPSPPFITSTLQQEASRKLSFSVSRTMTVAQHLYENGHISYMRTDSTNLSQSAIQALADTIEKEYGKHYVHTRQYATGKELAQEAHEAIRPTYPQAMNVSGDRDEQRLYELIWKRAIASQMADAEIEKTTVDISISTMTDRFLVATGEVIKFDGFLRVYLESTDDDEQEENKDMLPPLAVGQVLPLQEMNATERFTRPAPRYTEASLVKKLEELGIGRPSTYAPTISKITEQGRGYVTKENRDGIERPYVVLTLKKDNSIAKAIKKEIVGTEKNKLFPSDLGMIVSDFLEEYFKNVMNYGFTAEIEKQFDTIADGKLEWVKMIRRFYEPFHQTVASTLETAERVTGERVLGKDPNSGFTILTRMSRFGPVVQIGTPEELGEAKPRYGNLKAGQSMETIEINEALELFKLPRTLGTYQDAEVSIGTGRYGAYVKIHDRFISIPRAEDPLGITLDRAIQIIQENAPIGQYQGNDITRGTGRFGPFLKWGEFFVNIPKKYDLNTISLAEAIELIDAKLEKEANRVIVQWETEAIAIENGRWGPFIRFQKDAFKIPKKPDGNRYTPEEAAAFSLDMVKAWIIAEKPDAFAPPPPKAPKKRSTTTPKKKKE